MRTGRVSLFAIAFGIFFGATGCSLVLDSDQYVGDGGQADGDVPDEGAPDGGESDASAGCDDCRRGMVCDPNLDMCVGDCRIDLGGLRACDPSETCNPATGLCEGGIEPSCIDGDRCGEAEASLCLGGQCLDCSAEAACGSDLNNECTVALLGNDASPLRNVALTGYTPADDPTSPPVEHPIVGAQRLSAVVTLERFVGLVFEQGGAFYYGSVDLDTNEMGMSFFDTGIVVVFPLELILSTPAIVVEARLQNVDGTNYLIATEKSTDSGTIHYDVVLYEEAPLMPGSFSRRFAIREDTAVGPPAYFNTGKLVVQTVQPGGVTLRFGVESSIPAESPIPGAMGRPGYLYTCSHYAVVQFPSLQLFDSEASTWSAGEGGDSVGRGALVQASPTACIGAVPTPDGLAFYALGELPIAEGTIAPELTEIDEVDMGLADDGHALLFLSRKSSEAVSRQIVDVSRVGIDGELSRLPNGVPLQVPIIGEGANLAYIEGTSVIRRDIDSGKEYYVFSTFGSEDGGGGIMVGALRYCDGL